MEVTDESSLPCSLEPRAGLSTGSSIPFSPFHALPVVQELEAWKPPFSEFLPSEFQFRVSTHMRFGKQKWSGSYSIGPVTAVRRYLDVSREEIFAVVSGHFLLNHLLGCWAVRSRSAFSVVPTASYQQVTCKCRPSKTYSDLHSSRLPSPQFRMH